MWKQIIRAAAYCTFGLGAVHASGQAADEAASYPNKSVRFIVAFAPGGGTDVLARLLANELGKTWGQSFVVENKTGAGGLIAVQDVLNAPPDGYTVLIGGSAPMVFNPIVYKKLPYDRNEIVPVTILGSYPLVIAAKNDLPVKNIGDMIRLAKQKDSHLTYGHPGPTFQVPMEYLNSLAGIKMTAVPYRGGAPGVLALMAGDIDFMIADTTSIAAQNKAGKIRAIAVTTKQRNSVMPDVPTVAESGIPGFEASAFAAVGVSRKTPPAIVQKLQEAIAKALTQPEFKARMAELGIEPGGMPSAQAEARINHEIEVYTPIAETVGLKGSQ